MCSKLTLAFLLIVCSSVVFAQSPSEVDPRWVPVAVSELFIEYLDTHTMIEEQEGVYVVWLKREFNTAQDSGDKPFDRKILRERVDCRAQTLALLDVVSYLRGELGVSSMNIDLLPEVVVPGSVGEDKLEHICDKY